MLIAYITLGTAGIKVR